MKTLGDKYKREKQNPNLRDRLSSINPREIWNAIKYGGIPTALLTLTLGCSKSPEEMNLYGYEDMLNIDSVERWEKDSRSYVKHPAPFGLADWLNPDKIVFTGYYPNDEEKIIIIERSRGDKIDTNPEEIVKMKGDETVFSYKYGKARYSSGNKTIRDSLVLDENNKAKVVEKTVKEPSITEHYMLTEAGELELDYILKTTGDYSASTTLSLDNLGDTLWIETHQRSGNPSNDGYHTYERKGKDGKLIFSGKSHSPRNGECTSASTRFYYPNGEIKREETNFDDYENDWWDISIVEYIGDTIYVKKFSNRGPDYNFDYNLKRSEER